jgi:hypothetical protein
MRVFLSSLAAMFNPLSGLPGADHNAALIFIMVFIHKFAKYEVLCV